MTGSRISMLALVALAASIATDNIYAQQCGRRCSNNRVIFLDQQIIPATAVRLTTAPELLRPVNDEPKIRASFFASERAARRVYHSSVSIQLDDHRHTLSGHVVGIKSPNIATIVTTAHNLPVQPIVRYSNGQKAIARVVAVSRKYDVGILMARAPDDVSAIAISVGGTTPDILAQVGLGDGRSYRVTPGQYIGYCSIEHDGLDGPKYLSSASRDMKYNTDRSQMAITGDARPGDSGGAIVNQYGELVASVWGNSDPEEDVVYGTYQGVLLDLLERAKTVAGLTWDVAESRKQVAAAPGVNESRPF